MKSGTSTIIQSTVLIFTLLLTACGGGSAPSGSVAAGDVANYFADQQGGGVVGRWWHTSGASSVAKADVTTVLPNGTKQYDLTNARRVLGGGTNGGGGISGAWAADPAPFVDYALVASGWIESSDNATLLDSGDGTNITITPAGESAADAAITRTNLANIAIACTSSTTGLTAPCAVSGNYPEGAASYQLKLTQTSNRFILYGSASNASPVVGATGALLTALPAAGDTFCDPSNPLVFQAITPAPAAGAHNYNAFTTDGCTQAQIASALTTGTPAATFLISSQATGSAAVPNVLRIEAATGDPFLVGMVNTIFSVNAGQVWHGGMVPAGSTQTSTWMNKKALDAQLLASGLLALP